MKYCFRQFLVLLVFSCLLTSCSKAPEAAFSETPVERIICLGDSITQGVGAAPGEGFPSLLAQKLQPTVTNAGVGGDTTARALERLERDVLAKNPQLVIVEIGGNDYLGQVPAQTALQNIDRLVEKIQEQKIAVILVDAPYGIFKNEFNRGLRKIAEKRKTGFVPDMIAHALSTPHLKFDQIHPNREGYQAIADAILKEIRRIYGERLDKPV